MSQKPTAVILGNTDIKSPDWVTLFYFHMDIIMEKDESETAILF